MNNRMNNRTDYIIFLLVFIIQHSVKYQSALEKNRAFETIVLRLKIKAKVLFFHKRIFAFFFKLLFRNNFYKFVRHFLISSPSFTFSFIILSTSVSIPLSIPLSSKWIIPFIFQVEKRIMC